MRVRAEVIGAGALGLGNLLGSKLDHPAPFAQGEPMGQHLSVKKLIRVAPERLYYLVDNQSRKWPRRKCWACGYKYSPEMARSCAYCATPLEDLQFLMSQRWRPHAFPAYESFIKARIKHFGLITPVFAFYRGTSMMSVYHYNGESLLIDAPSPLSGAYLLAVAVRVANTLGYLHQRGVVLGSLTAANIVIMPNGSVRLFDLDVAELLPNGAAVWRHPDAPAERDMAALGRVLTAYVAPEDVTLYAFFRDAARGAYPTPVAFAEAAQQLHQERLKGNPDPQNISHAAAISDIGVARAENEDHFGWRKISPTTTLYAVADGLGGHTNGKEAASMAVEMLSEYLSRADLGKAPQGLVKAMTAGIHAANRAVLEHRNAHRVEMGATLTAAMVSGKHLIIGHVGDSRAYRLNQGKLGVMTRDHTLAQDLLEDGMIKAEDAPHHRGANILTQTIGGDDDLEPQVTASSVEAGDRLLLCSDGLYNALGDDNLEAGLGAWPDRHKTVRRLLRGALRGGSTDNVTLLVVDIP